MRIAVLGGGPGGLYFAALAKQLDARHDITVWERNAADDTFGFGVVFSDETLGGIEHADEEIFAAMRREFARWDDIDVHFRGNSFTSGGHGFAAMSRKRLLAILQARCASLGVRVHFRTEAPDVTALAADYDLVVAADGMNSATRSRFAPVFGPDLERRRCRYIWLGTDLVFDAFKFYILDTPAGVMQVHGYPYSEQASTFILEMHEDVWQRAGFGAVAASGLAPGQSDEASIGLIRGLCADVLGGPGGGQHSLVANNSRWTAFTTVRCQTWRHGNVVLLGDAAHTAHFSIGSGTKLAMEDALALAACLHEQDGVSDALAAYEAERRPVVASTQRAAQASLEWFENIGQYADQDPHQFAFNIVTRSRRVTYDNLRLRDPEFVADMDRWFASAVALDGGAAGGAEPRPPMFQPFRLGGLELANRVIVSPMDMYSARDGVPGDFHLVHLGSKALGGAGLVMTEMVCVSPAGRITPGCTGMYTAEQEESWRRIAGFVHEQTSAKIGIQLGHSGRKGSTRLMWEGMDDPLPDGNWEVCGPSPIPYAAGSQTPRELDPAELDEIKRAVRRGRPGGRAGGLRPARAALRARVPAVVVPFSADQPAHGPLRRVAGRAAPLPARGVRRDPRGVAAGPADDGADLGDRLVRGRPGHRRRRGDRPGVRRARRGRDRRVHRAGGQRGEARLRPQLPDAVRRPDPQRDRPQVRRGGDRGGRDLVLRRRELPHPGGPGRPVRAGPHPPVRPAVDPARRRRAGVRGPGRRLAAPVRRGQPQAAIRAHRRPAAAARPDPGRDAGGCPRSLAAFRPLTQCLFLRCRRLWSGVAVRMRLG